MLGRIGPVAVIGSMALVSRTGSAASAGTGSISRSTTIPGRLRGGAGRRGAGHDRRLPAAGLALLRRPRHHEPSGSSPTTAAAIGASPCGRVRRAGHRSSLHATLPAPDQRQGRAPLRTLLTEWSYARPFADTAERMREPAGILDFYNPPATLAPAGQPPISCTPVNNPAGKTPRRARRRR